MADALYAFQSLVPTGIALQYTAVEEGIVACLIFWGDVVLTRHVQGLLRTGGWSSPEGCLSLVSEAMTRIFIRSALYCKMGGARKQRAANGCCC
jgi:hypothetical protein